MVAHHEIDTHTLLHTHTQHVGAVNIVPQLTIIHEKWKTIIALSLKNIAVVSRNDQYGLYWLAVIPQDFRQKTVLTQSGNTRKQSHDFQHTKPVFYH